jgi:general secretion pathway protein G
MMNKYTTVRGRSRPGFTLIEAIVVIVIIGVLAAIIGPPLFSRIVGSKIATAGANAATIATQVKAYQMDYDSLPSSLNDLLNRPTDGKGHGPYLENADQLLDPWGHAFVLRIPPQKNAFFDIISYGADGQPGGDGENADIVKP